MNNGGRPQYKFAAEWIKQMCDAEQFVWWQREKVAEMVRPYAKRFDVLHSNKHDDRWGALRELKAELKMAVERVRTMRSDSEKEGARRRFIEEMANCRPRKEQVK